MKSIHVELSNEHGVHTRAAAQIVDCATQFTLEITLKFNALEVDAKRIMQVLTLGARCGDEVTISAEGMDEHHAIAAMDALVEKDLI